ncbi:MAG: copper resistance protein B [Sphingobium sp.]
MIAGGLSRGWAWIAALLLLALPMAAAAQEDHSAHQGHDGGHGAMPAADETPMQGGPRQDASMQAPPPVPTDHAADSLFDPAAMAAARKAMRKEAGGMGASMLMLDRLEWRPAKGADGYAWELEGWTGGDIDRIAIKSKGEGAFGGPLESAEVQLGWRHALDPWFSLRMGVRQDLEPRPRRTQAVLAIEGLAPYWFEVEGEIFLSHKGEVTARAEASYDQRITQSLILQPAAELTISAQKVPERGQGAGLTSIELGLRLRYEIAREFAPYLGLNWERRLGRTADYRRAEGEKPGSLRFVTGIRLWF